jgi:hypothetical protein
MSAISSLCFRSPITTGGMLTAAIDSGSGFFPTDDNNKINNSSRSVTTIIPKQTSNLLEIREFRFLRGNNNLTNNRHQRHQNHTALSSSLSVLPGKKVTRRNTVLQQCHDKLLWLHTPKTGSTLCMLLQHLCCPYEFLNITQGITTEMLEENELLSKAERSFDFISTIGCISFIRKVPAASEPFNKQRRLAYEKEFREVDFGEQQQVATTTTTNNNNNNNNNNIDTTEVLENEISTEREEIEMPSSRNLRFKHNSQTQSTGICRIGGLGDHNPLITPHSIAIMESSSSSSSSTSSKSNRKGRNSLDYRYQQQSKKSLFITMIRHPRSRLLSSYLDSVHHEGLEEHVWRELIHNFTLIQDGKYTYDDLGTLFSSSPSAANFTNFMVGDIGRRDNGIVGTHDAAHGTHGTHTHYYTLDQQTNNKVNTTINLNFVEKQKLKLFLYQRLPQSYGCQVKMLNGWDCFANVLSLETNEFNHTALEYAKQVLREKFVVVGIFDEYTLSMKLMMKRLYPHILTTSETLSDEEKTEKNMDTVTSYPESLLTLTPVETFPQRTSGSKAFAKILQRQLQATFHDPYDEALYEEAKKIFQNQLKESGLTY